MVPFVVPFLAALTICDFESPNDRKRVWEYDRGNYGSEIVERFSTSGTHSWHIWLKPWKDGLYSSYQGFYLKMPKELSDWRGYDRLTVDICTTADGGDQCILFLASPDAPDSKKMRIMWLGHGRGFKRLVFPLVWPAEEVHPDSIQHLFFQFRMPQATDIYVDNITLLKPGESLPPMTGIGVANDLLPVIRNEADASAAALVEASRKARKGEAQLRFVADCIRAGTVKGGMVIGQATSMENVKPKDDFSARPADRVSLKLARNETEAVQILVSPLEGGLRNVRVSCSDLVGEKDGCSGSTPILSSKNVKCSIVGYGNVTNKPGYRVHPGVHPIGGWYPDMLLDFIDRVDVQGMDVQSFWISVACPKEQAAGTYRGALFVSADGEETCRIPFTVRVYDFALEARDSPLPLMITFYPKASDKSMVSIIGKSPESPMNMWRKRIGEWADFLADHYVTMDNIYLLKPVALEKFYLEAWRRLKEQGRLGWHCIGYVNPIPDGDDGERKWRETNLKDLHDLYAIVKREGLLSKAYFYGCDEVPLARIESVRRAVEIVKAEFPEIPITTTGCTKGYGTVGSPGERLSMVDMFVPLTGSYSLDVAEKARAEGRKVGWYICNNPDYPYAQMFTESHPIETRLLMGAMTAKMRPDAFLIWQITEWNSPKCIETGPYTDWIEKTWGTDNGDGSWVCAGPDGRPVSTIRFENFRDGLEDLAYVKLYEKKFGRKVNVPASLVRTMTAYSHDHRKLLAWRDSIAAALESKQDGNDEKNLAKEDVPVLFGPEYERHWSKELNAEIDARIEKHRKADAEASGFAAGSEVKVEQVDSEFGFGCNIFNFDQLGDSAQNAEYKRAFLPGGLFNCATVPFYWKEMEPECGHIRYTSGYEDKPEFWDRFLAEHRGETFRYGDESTPVAWRRPAPDRVLAFCHTNGIAVHGHAIIYPSYPIQWLQDRVKTPDDMARFMKRRIADIASYYGDTVGQWDVVNESVDRTSSMEDPHDHVCWGEQWGRKKQRIILPRDYTLMCYKEAEELFPSSVRLCINDAWPIGGQYPAFVRKLQRQGAKIDVVGLQRHQFSAENALLMAQGLPTPESRHSWFPEEQIKHLKDLDRCGCPIHISEITIPEPRGCSGLTKEQSQMVQTRLIRDNFRLWFSWPSVYRISYWNLVDSVGGEILYSGFYNRDMSKKPAYWTLHDLVNREWRTHLTVKANDEGRISFRGFKGNYIIRGIDSDGKQRTIRISVK